MLRRNAICFHGSVNSNLADQGVVGVAVTIVDNAGVARVKGVPLARLDAAATEGVGGSPVFDAFGMDDSIAPAGGPMGDLRLVADRKALALLGGSPGWAWAPADRVELDGTPYRGCQRSFARRQRQRAAEMGLEVRMAFETEWVLGGGGTDEFVPASDGPAYGMGRLVDLADYARDLLEELDRSGVEVAQLHPEYAAGQMELSVSPQDPVGAADRVVLVRQVIRGVSAAHGYRASLSPAVTAGGVGSGGHVHASIWRGADNLLAEVDGRFQVEGQRFVAGLLDHLPALTAVVAPSVVSYLRLIPQRWSAPWRCWGRENREAALRVIAGRADSGGRHANVECKIADATANPYLVVGCLVAAGLDGIERGLTLPEPCTGDPAALDDAAREAAGITRLPDSLGAALDAFEADPVLRDAMGAELAGTWLSVRRAELDRFAGADPDEIAAASRWVW